MPAPAGRAIEVQGEISRDAAALRFVVAGPVPLIPAKAMSQRADDLWKTTCFELFIAPLGEPGYVEFNFSPSTRWAAYAFDAYRGGMRRWPLAASPQIEPIENGIRVTVDVSHLPPPPWQIGLSAVIEERDGTKSYWALGHAPGAPDFHNRDCFIATLAAPTRP
ncbi:DOMON-like domain-containing protein [Sphingomonas qilianensis]